MPHTLSELCQEFDVAFSGNGDLVLERVCGLDRLLPRAVAFATQESELAAVHADPDVAVVVPPGFESDAHNLIFAHDPLGLHVKITAYLHPQPAAEPGIHPSAVVGRDVKLGEGVTVDAHVVLYDGVEIGERSVLRAGVVIMNDSTVGDDCLLYPNVTLRERCHLGNRVIVHSGAVIGADGYGFFQREGIHHKIPQIGGVVIEDDVELGACAAIDRARFYETIVRSGTKVDNFVHVAHNAEVGAHSLLVAFSGLGGSAKSGHHLVLGGKAGILQHVTVGDHVTVAAQSSASKDTPGGAVLAGHPGRPVRKWKRTQAFLQRLEELFQRVKRLEARVEAREVAGREPVGPASGAESSQRS